MKKIVSIFSIFLLSLKFVGPNKSSPHAFTDASSFVKASENEESIESRSANNDISFEPDTFIDNLVLGEQISGELSQQNTYCYYKFTSSSKVVTRLNLYHNFVYNRGVTCDVYKKLGNRLYYMHLFTYNSSTVSNDVDFPEVPCYPGETYLYRLKDKDGVNVRFSIVGSFEEVTGTNCVSFDYATGYLKTFYFNISEDPNVPKQGPIGSPANPNLDLRNIIYDTTNAPYKNIAKFKTHIYRYYLERNCMQYVGVAGASGFLIGNGIVGTAAHCVINPIKRHDPTNTIPSSDLETYGIWPCKPEIHFGLSNTTTSYPITNPLKAFFSLKYYFKDGDDYPNFDWAFLLINPSSNYSDYFELFPDNGSSSILQIFKNSVANGYTGNGINNSSHQYERNVSYFSRESKYIFQYYANVWHGQSGGPLYIFYNNKYYAIGIITGLHVNSGLNFSVSYNQHHINLINYIVNNGGQL